ncbi:hypothetical protein FLAG1_10461 [Fusarium langsethiae]|uniref:ubiquitinyl hydrolase 1 n=1 Tax=Fusarium langsethiae TaxID=179993 RepID=A0A0N0DBJ2_FUSLA|nr:hypothetical protein FLAG1_10461 [Fusarium langsethiae]
MTNISPSDEQFGYLFRHVFLPAKLPGHDDTSGANESFLVGLVLHSLEQFFMKVESVEKTTIAACISMIKNMIVARDMDGYLGYVGLRESLRMVSADDPFSLFHITAQNAGLLIRRTDDSFCFETFELSPSNESIMSTKGRLVRQFPASATKMSAAVFENSEFQEVLANTLVKMAKQTVAEVQQKTRKAKQEHAEDRDTADPRIVTELLTSIIRGVGKSITVEGVCKNTREEVMWSRSKLPWRRSPVWLLVRVGLHLTTRRLAHGSDDMYKRFMIFFMAQVLHIANRKLAQSEVLHIMMIKLSRRICKLDNPQDGPWLQEVNSVVSTASVCLHQRWANIRNCLQKPLDLEKLSKIKMENNLRFSIPEMDRFVATILHLRRNPQNSIFEPSSNVFTLEIEKLPLVTINLQKDYISFALAMFETWIRDYLSLWMEGHIEQESCCEELQQSLYSYHNAAAGWYSSLPEGASRMLLTIGELWIAIDNAATHRYPMLLEYETEVPTDVWQALLLHSKDNMTRLHRLESHLLERKRTAALHGRPSIFRSYGETSSFSVKYFAKSSKLQAKKMQIEQSALQRRQAKIQEFRRLEREYDDMMTRSDSMACNSVSVRSFDLEYDEHISSRCNRCCLQQKAKGLRISVHEWPLPDGVLEAQSTVFELEIPRPFSIWRDVTFFLIEDVLAFKSVENRPKSSYPLASYQGLAPWFVPEGNRVQLLSGAEPQVVIHWKEKTIERSTEADVCLNNGLIYQYYDGDREIFISSHRPSFKISDQCTFQLPNRAKALKRFLTRTWAQPNGQTPNEVIASQSDCPDYMPLSEFKALATLPFGHRIQWMSILVQLAMPMIDFNRPETTIFLLQINIQVGPYGAIEVERPTHRELLEMEFGHKMLISLTQFVSRVKESWESHTSLCSLTILTTRLLTLADPALSDQIQELLSNCRNISYDWLLCLIEKVQETKDDVRRAEFLRIVVTVALICAESFNTDDEFLSQILADSGQAAILVEISIIIYSNSSLASPRVGHLQNVMFDRFLQTMHRACPILVREAVVCNNNCLDIAIKRRWPAFYRSSKWRLSPSSFYWMKTTSGDLQVHLSALTGELLVDGCPLSRLPREFIRHENYQKLFGFMVLDVAPSDLSGMRFCAIKTFCDFKVHFGIQDLSGDQNHRNLLVQLHKGSSILDLIPPRLMRDLLPHHFVDNFIHWYHRTTGTIEFCDIGDPWVTNKPRNWYLRRDGGGWKLDRRTNVILMPPSSHLAQAIASIMSPIEAPLRIHLLYGVKEKVLNIQIPGLQLEFFLKSGGSIIQSRQFRNMIIDNDQSLGTLIGLASKLILRNIGDPSIRTVIIPEGKVEHRPTAQECTEDHVRVMIVHGTAHRVQPYKIDSVLRRLVADDKIETKLFLAYIHALTSFLVPDPFIRRTGAEEALRILTSAQIRAPCALSNGVHERLSLISHLSPDRSFYPSHKRVMQTVEWSPSLSYISQDGRFHTLTQQILAKSHEVSFLHPGYEVLDLPRNISTDLVERAINRNARDHVTGFGAEDFTPIHDIVYLGRDRGQHSVRAVRASDMAFRVYHGHYGLLQPVMPGLTLYLYELLRKATVSSMQVVVPKARLFYDSRWLQEPETFLSSEWCQLHCAFQREQEWLNNFELMVWTATMSYSEKYDPQIVQALLALGSSPSVTSAPLPPETTFDLKKGYEVQIRELENLAGTRVTIFEHSPEVYLPPLAYEKHKSTLERRKQVYRDNKTQAIADFRHYLSSQWPCKSPSTPPRAQTKIHTYIDVEEVMSSVRPKWKEWYMNLQLKRYLDTLVSRLNLLPIAAVAAVRAAPGIPPCHSGRRASGFVSITDLFSGPAPRFDRLPALDRDGLIQMTTKKDEDASNKLTEIIETLDSSANLEFEHRYMSELRDSISSLYRHADTELNEKESTKRLAIFEQYLTHCENQVMDMYKVLVTVTMQSTKRVSNVEVPKTVQSILEKSGFVPRVAPVLFLQQLRSSQWVSLPEAWRSAIVSYGLAITAVQQARRLVQFQSSPTDLLRELKNVGNETWDPQSYPDWLLLQCESEIMIRDTQQCIARQMIDPPDRQNAVMQLNMGEGKSTVIVPIVATALADGSKLVRVIVAKPQAKQMHQILVSKLSGLLDRPVYLLPFSRDIRMNACRAQVIRQLMEDCIKEGGVLMVQPEQLLSFQLMELECQLNESKEAAGKLMETRLFLDKSSRDIVDESDENFSVKFELIYTIGQQRPIEHSPDRWLIIQNVLGLLAKLGRDAKGEFAHSLEYDDHVGERFPRMRFLEPEAEKEILKRVANSICDTGLVGLPIARQPQRMRTAIFRYITRWELASEDSQMVEQSTFWDETTKGHILLLRGLFAGGILAFSFGQKRWRVNYGIDPHREKKTKLAVPYRAKDNPTPRSEFSHPDVVITLTCLSYYYSGLGHEALFSAFRLLVKSDTAKVEYQDWVKTAPALPDSFRNLEGVNLQDRDQCITKIFPCIQYSKATIDYYLCHLVFAKESREFPHKLSASGWDLGKRKDNPTTGFSGTNDSRYVLPIGMAQLDLPEQKHTNALVLEYLLRPENTVALTPRKMKGATLDGKMLLRMVSGMSPEARVILDVGAQIIDLNNLEFSKRWLACYEGRADTQAVVCFSDHDEIIVVDRSGKVEELRISPFAEQLDQCLVFLDEAHTRGTDLKLPTYYRAAVTLGTALTKDRLVQACMRMRRLGEGQSVVFCVPWEIEQKIAQWRTKTGSSSCDITVSDIICWSITETCLDLRKAIPLWLTQGARFSRHEVLWKQRVTEEKGCSWARGFLEDEALSLNERYRPCSGQVGLSSLWARLDGPTIDKLKARCDAFGLTKLHTSSLQEEQERELSPETEQEQQVERPPKVEPENHDLAQPLKTWVSDGYFPGETDVFRQAFTTLADTSAARHFDVHGFPRNIWVTRDFATTVRGTFGQSDDTDLFQRSVQWILAGSTKSSTHNLVVASPYEIEELLPLIRSSSNVALHLYAPRINLGFQPLDHLRLYCVSGNMIQSTIPKDSITFLNLFAGQVYLKSFQDYITVCDSLGLAWAAVDDSVCLGPDGFIHPNVIGTLVNRSGFSKSPIQFLKVLMEKIRQNCGAITRTDMGKIFEGVVLLKDDFEGRDLALCAANSSCI